MFKGSDDYRTCGEPVFVQIPDGPHWNRVRRGKLVLFKFQNEWRLCSCYTVLNKLAFICSWVDSERGEYLKHNEALDNQRPKPDLEMTKKLLTRYGF